MRGIQEPSTARIQGTQIFPNVVFYAVKQNKCFNELTKPIKSNNVMNTLVRRIRALQCYIKNTIEIIYNFKNLSPLFLRSFWYGFCIFCEKDTTFCKKDTTICKKDTTNLQERYYFARKILPFKFGI